MIEEPVPFGTEETGATIKVSLSVHDVEECKKAYGRILLSAVITSFVHYKWGYIPPLLIQSIMGVLNCFQSPLVRVYLRGYKATGELKRPWKDASNAMAKNLKSVGETFNSAMTGEPVVPSSRKNNKKKSTKRKNK